MFGWLAGSSVQCGLASGHFHNARNAVCGGPFSTSGSLGAGHFALLSDEAVLSHLHLTGVELGLNLIMILLLIPHLGIGCGHVVG